MSAGMSQTPGGPRLLVGIANPNTMPQLMKLAASLALSANYHVTAAHVITVARGEELDLPDDAPARREAEELLRQAALSVADMGVGVDTFIEVAREAHDGLLSAVTVEGADLLLVGYADEIPGADKAERAFDRVMHRVARGAKCDLIVAKFRSDSCDSVVVPVACDVNTRVSAAVARALSENMGATVRLVHVVEPGANPSESELLERCIMHSHGLERIGAYEMIRTPRPAAALTEEVNDADVAIIGAAKQSALASAIFGSLADRIAGRATSTVLVVRARRDAD